MDKIKTNATTNVNRKIRKGKIGINTQGQLESASDHQEDSKRKFINQARGKIWVFKQSSEFIILVGIENNSTNLVRKRNLIPKPKEKKITNNTNRSKS